ncbi:hypothetical protein AAHC03_04554 [Spirometra sp. Aus1]
MLGLPGRVPKTVTVRVQRASGLVNPHIDGKKKPKALKWRVAVKSGKKKLESDSVVDAAGNPSWDFEVTLKIAKIDEPVAIKVTDSDGHHIGQVIIPLVKIPPRPADPSKRPASPSRLCAAELEPTRKVSHVTGTLYYWVWAEDFYDDDGPPKSSRSSALGSVHLHRSASRLSGIVHHKSKHGADAASVQGSTISMYSKTGDKSDKPWYKKHTGKHIREALHRSHKTDSRNGSEISYTMSQSMGSLFPDAVVRKDNPSSYLGHDGSVLGASSVVSGSDLYGGDSSHLSSGGRPVTVQNPLPAVPSPDMTPALSRAGSQRKVIQPSAEVSRPAEIKRPERSPSSLLSKAQNRKSSSSSVSASKTAINESPQPTPPAAPPRSSESSARREPVSILKPPKEVSDSDMSSNSDSDADELSSRPPQKTSSSSVTANAAPRSNTPPEPDPVLLSLTPTSGSAEGDFEIFVFASGLTDSVMKSALLLIDGYTIATNRWKVEVGHWAEAPVGTTHRLTVRLPPMPVGRVYLELETMFKGRLRCPQAFTFEATAQPPSPSPPIPLFPAKKPSAVVSPSAKPGPPAEEDSPISGSTGPSSSPGHTSLVRTGSQRDSIRLTDKRQRSFRAGRPSDEQPSVTVSSTADVMYSGSARTRSSGFGSEDSASELGTVRTVDPNASVAEIRAALAEAEATIAKLKLTVTNLEGKLASKTVDVDRVSSDLCKLRLRLLEDGKIEYLEKRG